MEQKEEARFTAWLSVTADVAGPSGCMDVMVLEDKVTGYTWDRDKEEEIEEWTSAGDPLFSAVTAVPAADGDAEDGIAQAEALLAEGGWITRGQWDDVPTGYTTRVERR